MPDKFGFAKLVVGDLEKMARFYEAIAELEVQVRVNTEVGGRKVSEILYKPSVAGGASFLLFAYHDTPEVVSGEMIVGFNTTDIEGFLGRVSAHGGVVTDPPHGNVAAPGLLIAYATDPEGHVIEVIQRP